MWEGHIPHELIARRAWIIWDREGRPQGKEKEHWQLAEKELREFNGIGRMVREYVEEPQRKMRDAVRDALRQHVEEQETHESKLLR